MQIDKLINISHNTVITESEMIMIIQFGKISADSALTSNGLHSPHYLITLNTSSPSSGTGEFFTRHV
jgi:hypothetical protein